MLPDNTRKSHWSSFLLIDNLETMPNFGRIHPMYLEINFEAADGWDWLDSQPDSVYLLHMFNSHFNSPGLNFYFHNYVTGYWT